MIDGQQMAALIIFMVKVIVLTNKGFLSNKLIKVSKHSLPLFVWPS